MCATHFGFTGLVLKSCASVPKCRAPWGARWRACPSAKWCAVHAAPMAWPPVTFQPAKELLLNSFPSARHCHHKHKEHYIPFLTVGSPVAPCTAPVSLRQSPRLGLVHMRRRMPLIFTATSLQSSFALGWLCVHHPCVLRISAGYSSP